jgi:hypothetical protein
MHITRTLSIQSIQSIQSYKHQTMGQVAFFLIQPYPAHTNPSCSNPPHPGLDVLPYCVRQEESKSASLPERVEEV